MQANTIATTPIRGTGAPVRDTTTAAGGADPFAQMLARQRAAASTSSARERAVEPSNSRVANRPEATAATKPATSAESSAATEPSDSANTIPASPESPASADAVAALDATLAQAGANAVAAATNPLVDQIQQLTERSRLLADTVVALRNHPAELPAEPAVLVQALQGTLPAAQPAAKPLAPALAPNTTEAPALAPTLQTAPQTQAMAPPGAASAATGPGGGPAAGGAVAENTPTLAALPPEPGPTAQATPAPVADPRTATIAASAATAERPADAPQEAEAWIAPLHTSPSAGLSTSATPPLPAQVHAPLHSPHWGAAFSQQIVPFGANGRQGLQQIELRLDPPDLGPVRIGLHLAGEQASAWFVSPHAAVRQAIEQALPHLQQALADAGIQLGQTSVGEHANPEQADPDARGQGGSQPAGGVAQDDTGAGLPVGMPARPRGLVDTFA
ncbi:MAG: flagellar hook-length control protein FliK [Pigmentiphaga sp.]|nr:flagellar hook-length control protein FliK [Pigmentiphaga sp.]